MAQRKKSDQVKQRQGTFRKDRKKPDVKGATVPPVCPEWLSEAAKIHWNKTIKTLVDLGVSLHPADQDSLGTYCSLFARQMEDPHQFGPALVSQLRSIWAEFGLTPASRANLGLTGKTKSANPFKK